MTDPLQRFEPGAIVFLRLRVVSIDREHHAPIAVETVDKAGRPTEASLTHWVRPDHLLTAEEIRDAARRR